MHDFTAKRTLVKSPPELWSELSEVERLARHLGAFGEIKITKLEPERAVAWEGESASGTVSIEPSGWGTKVTLTASVVAAEPEPEGDPEEASDMRTELQEPLAEEPQPTPRRGFLARLFGRERGRMAPTDSPVWVAGAPEREQPEPAPEPAEPAEPDPTQAILEEALEALGSAHHRPFSRG
jgi:hypothetical protein